MRTTELVTCSQTISRPSASSVIPLPLLLGFATSRTPPCSSQRRRVSPGMSLKRRYCPDGFQIGPSVNVKPVPSCSASADGSIRSWSCSDSALTPTRRSFHVRFGCAANLTRCSRGVPPLDAAEDLAQPLEAREVVPGEEAVDVGERGAHAGGERLVPGAALERVDPHDREGLVREPLHLPAEQPRA